MRQLFLFVVLSGLLEHFSVETLLLEVRCVFSLFVLFGIRFGCLEIPFLSLAVLPACLDRDEVLVCFISREREGRIVVLFSSGFGCGFRRACLCEYLEVVFVSAVFVYNI